MDSTQQTILNELFYWQSINAQTCDLSSHTNMGAWSEWDKITDPDDDD